MFFLQKKNKKNSQLGNLSWIIIFLFWDVGCDFYVVNLIVFHKIADRGSRSQYIEIQRKVVSLLGGFLQGFSLLTVGWLVSSKCHNLFLSGSLFKLKSCVRQKFLLFQKVIFLILTPFYSFFEKTSLCCLKQWISVGNNKVELVFFK